jgi:hypothetical protein
MFRCERCETRFTNTEARSLEHCPLCQEDGELSPLVLKVFVTEGPLHGAVERTRKVMRELGARPEAGRSVASPLAAKLPARHGRSKDISEGKGASP